MKVGIIGRFPPENIPFATHTKNLVDHLSKKCEVIKIGLKDSECDYVIKINKNFTKTLSEIVEKEDLDILHIQYIASSDYFAQNNKFPMINYFNTILSNIRLFRALDKMKIPKVVTLHELNIESKNIKQLTVRWLEKKIMESSNKVIVHSVRQKTVLVNKKINAVFIRFGLTPINVEKRGGKNLLYLATIYPSRGVEYLIRALKFLPNYKLIIKGPIFDESYASLLEDEIKRNHLTNVNLGFEWGTLKDRDRLYRQADIVVLPYLWAPNQSAALHDAFSYRTPVVVTNTNGPIEETVREFNCGEVVEMRNPHKLAEGIIKVHKNYRKYVKSINNYRKVSNWNSVASKHIEVYKELMKAGA